MSAPPTPPTAESVVAESAPPAAAAPPMSRDANAWARPVNRLVPGAVGGTLDHVTGRRVAGPMQGFGQMWQKTFRVRLEGVPISPRELISMWKANFPAFWPPGQRFYAPLAGIKPGEVALLELSPVPGPVRLSTGVMVIYADEESFAFMTPEGHLLSGWITFSASDDGGVTVVQAQALERPYDPLAELSYLLGGNRMNDTFWVVTLTNLARHLGVAQPKIEVQKVCVDPHRQWRHARNLRYSVVIQSVLDTVTAPVRWLRRR